MFRARNDLDIILGKRRRILGRMVGSCIVGVTYRREYGSCIEGMGVTYRQGSAFSAGWSGAASSESPTDGNTGAAS